MNCPCEQNQCSGSNPNQVLEVINEKPILFHKVIYPASLGDDNTVDVNELNYRNVLLVFEANNHSYLFSSDGIPTRIDGEAGDLETIKEQIAALGGHLAEEEETRAAADEQLTNQFEQLQSDLTNETTARRNEDEDLQNQLTNLSDTTGQQIADLQSAVTSVDTEVSVLQNTTVQKDTTVSGDASTVTITKTTGTLNEEGTETAMPLPVASETEAGVMNPATFKAVQENSENIDSILGGAVVLENLPTEPTDEQLTTAWKNATGKTELINRASIYDETNKKVWYYYENANAWKPISTDGTEVTVSIATNDTAGIVKGSTEDGQVAVEADGSMSLNGYDGMQHDIDNLTQLVAGIEVPDIKNMLTGRISPTGDIGARLYTTRDANSVNIIYGAYGANKTWVPLSTVFPAANSFYAGTMSASDKSKLDSLLAIKSLNDSLELDENGQLSIVGGGSSDVNLLSGYTATVGDNDVYNAAYVNAIFGNNLYAPVRSNSGYIAIGNGISPTTMGASAVAIGNQSSATSIYGVALGAKSKATSNFVAVGNGDTSDNFAGFRIIRYVRAGVLDTDAVNLKQMQDYVAENAGNPFTEMETTRVQNLPPAVVTGFEDTTYGTDTITMHLDTKDLATGGVSVQELMLEGATANTAEEGGHAGLMTAFQATQLAALAEGGGGGGQLTTDEVTKVQNLGTGSLTNMDGVLQTEEAVEIEFSRQNLVAGGSTTQTATIAAATTEEAGVMTPAMVIQLSSLTPIVAATADEITAAWEAA